MKLFALSAALLGAPLAYANPTPAQSAAAATTPAAAEEFLSYIEWVFDTPLTESQKAEATALIQKAFESDDKNAIDLVKNAAAAKADFVNYSEGERESLRPSVEDEYLKILRMAYRSQPLTRWIFAVKAGAPAAAPTTALAQLSRSSTDAIAEMMAFVVNEAGIGASLVNDARYREAFARTLGGEFNRYSPQEQSALSEAGVRWSDFRNRWNGYSEEKKAELRTTWRELLRPLTVRVAAAPSGAADVQSASYRSGATSRAASPRLDATDKTFRAAARDLAAKLADWR